MPFAIPVDIISVAIFLIAIFSLALYLGKGATVSAIISLYTSLLLFKQFPYSESLFSRFASNEVYFLKGGLFLIFFLASHIIIRNAVSAMYSWTPFIKIVEAGILSVLITGLSVIALSEVTGSDKILELAPSITPIFTFDQAQFWWFAGGLIALFFTVKR